MSGAGTESYGDLLVTSVAVLAVVCVAAFVIVRIAGRWLTTGRSKGAQLLDVIARLPLEPRRSLYVVAVGGKTLLVGTSEMGMSLLTELDGHEVQARTPERTSFADLVKSAWSRRRGLHVTDPDSAPAASAVTSRYGAAAATGDTGDTGDTGGAGVASAAAASSPAQGPGTRGSRRWRPRGRNASRSPSGGTACLRTCRGRRRVRGERWLARGRIVVSGGSGALLVALVAVVPIVILMMTSFVKLSVVLSLLRNAIGAPDAPSGLVVMGISLVLTFFVMAPVAVDMINAATATPAPVPMPAPAPVPMPAPAPAPAPGGASTSPTEPAPASAATASAGSAAPAPAGPERTASADGSPVPPVVGPPVDFEGAVRKLVPDSYRSDVDAGLRAIGPLKAFLQKHSADRDRETFVGLATRMGRGVHGDELWVLAPAFLATELREAFAIAVLIFLPFLVIDLVVGLGLAALGLQNTQVQTIALPLKLLLFVAVDGWRLLLESLLRGYV